MNRSYELWDIETGNVIGAFSTEDESLGVVQTLLDAYGLDYAEALTLSSRDGNTPSKVIATGEQLVAMVGRPARRRNEVANPARSA